MRRDDLKLWVPFKLYESRFASVEILVYGEFPLLLFSNIENVSDDTIEYFVENLDIFLSHPAPYKLISFHVIIFQEWFRRVHVSETEESRKRERERIEMEEWEKKVKATLAELQQVLKHDPNWNGIAPIDMKTEPFPELKNGPGNSHLTVQVLIDMHGKIKL